MLQRIMMTLPLILFALLSGVANGLQNNPTSLSVAGNPTPNPVCKIAYTQSTCISISITRRASKKLSKKIKLYKIDALEKKNLPNDMHGLLYELATQTNILRSYLASLRNYSQTEGYLDEISPRKEKRQLKHYRKWMSYLIGELTKMLSRVDCFSFEKFTAFDTTTTLSPIKIVALREIYMPSYGTTKYVNKILRKIKQKGKRHCRKSRKGRRRNKKNKKVSNGLKKKGQRRMTRKVFHKSRQPGV